MSAILFLEQGLNGVQFGLMLFLLAAGLTLVFGIMDMINLAHGSLYMIGAYFMASFVQMTGSFWLGLPLALGATALVGAVLEVTLLRKLYGQIGRASCRERVEIGEGERGGEGND